jgi:hypothetical protein
MEIKVAFKAAPDPFHAQCGIIESKSWPLFFDFGGRQSVIHRIPGRTHGKFRPQRNYSRDQQGPEVDFLVPGGSKNLFLVVV